MATVYVISPVLVLARVCSVWIWRLDAFHAMQDETFVAGRAAALESYINKVVIHPALTQSLDLLVFLDASDAGLEAARQ